VLSLSKAFHGDSSAGHLSRQCSNRIHLVGTSLIPQQNACNHSRLEPLVRLKEEYETHYRCLACGRNVTTSRLHEERRHMRVRCCSKDNATCLGNGRERSMGHPSLRDVRQQLDKHPTTAGGLNRRGKNPRIHSRPAEHSSGVGRMGWRGLV
jgi:DNA-directed RNA polymerase subunit RPC12/RpoP